MNVLMCVPMRNVAAFVCIVGLAAVGCSGSDERPQPSPSATVRPPTAATPSPAASASSTLSQGIGGRLLDRFATVRGGGREALTVDKLEEVLWPDACLGVQRPTVVCAERQVRGYRALIRFQREPFTWEVRTDISLDTFVWVAEVQAEGVTARIDADGTISLRGSGPPFDTALAPGQIEAEIAPGTEFLTPLADLGVGQRVAFGIAGRPSSDVAALVWIVRLD